MIAIILIIIFLLAGWITLIIPLEDLDIIQLTLAIAMGLAAVNIASSTIIIRKLNCLHNKLQSHKTIELKDDEKTQKDKT